MRFSGPIRAISGRSAVSGRVSLLQAKLCSLHMCSFAGQHLNHEPKAAEGSAKCLAGSQTAINTQFARIALIIEMKRKSIIRTKQRFEAKCVSLKNGCCCESLAGLYSSSGEFCATSVEKGLSNNRLQGTGTRKVGQASKVLFRSVVLRKRSPVA